MTQSKQILFSERAVLGVLPEELRLASALIIIEHGIITEIIEGSRGQLQGAHEWDDVEDLGNTLLTPAFVNAHTHLCMVGFRGIGGLASKKGNVVEDLYFRLENQLEEKDVLAFSRIGAIEALLMGTGFCWDHYYYASAVAQALQEVGIAAAIGPTLQDLSGPGVSLQERAWQETFAIDESSFFRQKGIVAAIAPHATDTVSDELWRRVAELSMVCNLPIHTHLAQSIEEVERNIERYGKTPLQRMQDLGICDLSSPRLWVHGLYLTETELDALNPELDYLGHCPSAQMQFAFPAHIHSWRKRGLKVVVGTDAASCNDSINLQGELRFMAAADSYAITMGDALKQFRASGLLSDAQKVKQARQQCFTERAAYIAPKNLLYTLWGATHNLHPKAPVGAIAVGSWANLCCWDTNHPALWPATEIWQALAYNNAPQALQRIMILGNWKFDGEGLLSHRISHSFRVESWLKEATERLDQLRVRAGI